MERRGEERRGEERIWSGPEPCYFVGGHCEIIYIRVVEGALGILALIGQRHGYTHPVIGNGNERGERLCRSSQPSS